MEIRITHFSQDVSLVDPEQGKFFIVVETGDGESVRIPVQRETTDALIKLAFTKKEQPKEESPEEVLRNATVQELAEKEDESALDEDLDKPLWIPNAEEEEEPSPSTYATDEFDEEGSPILDEDGVASV